MQKETLFLIGGVVLGLGIIAFIMWDVTHFALFSPPQEQLDAKNAKLQEEASTQAGSGKVLAKTDAPGVQSPSPQGGASESTAEKQPSFSPPTQVEGACPQTQIAYGLKNFNAETDCLTLVDTTCIEKKVECSVLVHNLDKETSGLFRIRFSLFDLSDPDKTSLQQAIDEQSVSAESQEEFHTSFIVYNETAQKQLSCNTHTEIVPKKAEC